MDVAVEGGVPGVEQAQRLVSARGMMVDQDQNELQFNASVARMLHREALRRAAQNIKSTSEAGLESMLARISAEATAAAAEQLADRTTAEQDKKKAGFRTTDVLLNSSFVKGNPR